MRAYNLLSEPIRRYIRDKGWEELRDIQASAIEHIMGSDSSYILASRTASGKTEAAFLPILSKVNFSKRGVRVLYISPLIALINDQFYRIEDLCKYMDIPVTKWHGEANRTLKEKIIKDPEGIVLITPESLEAMLSNRLQQARQLFSGLEYVVIDEIHSFIGGDRGIHLRSILYRLQRLQVTPFRIVGLSATLSKDGYHLAKAFAGPRSPAVVLVDNTIKETEATFRFHSVTDTELPLALIKRIYLDVCDKKVLLFPNNRGRAEEIAVKLKKIAEKINGHSHYFSHHSSVDKEVREYVENFAKSNVRLNFCISCTSTLELGIDIGNVDLVVQLDAAYSIASLIQRVGRSGRREGKPSSLLLYATREWSLLQSVACWQLYKEPFIEPPFVVARPYDILLHQLLAVIKSNAEMSLQALLDFMKADFAFDQITVAEIQYLIEHLLNIDFLEKIGNVLILGMSAEPLVNSKDFYSVFVTEDYFKVMHAGNKIGEIPFQQPMAVSSGQEDESVNIFLAAKIWKIMGVDVKRKIIDVMPAKDGKKPVFIGGSPAVHTKVREKMLALVVQKAMPPFLDEPAQDALEGLYKFFAVFSVSDSLGERPLLDKGNKCEIYSFTGTTTNAALSILFRVAGCDNHVDDERSVISVGSPGAVVMDLWKRLPDYIEEVDEWLTIALQEHKVGMDFSKFGVWLPDNYKVALLKQKLYDFEGAKRLLESVVLKLVIDA